jgi:benzoylformate decarboxylase
VRRPIAAPPSGREGRADIAGDTDGADAAGVIDGTDDTVLAAPLRVVRTTAVALVADDPAEVHRSPADLAFITSPAAVRARLAVTPPAHSTAVPCLPARAAPPVPRRRPGAHGAR